MGRAGLYDRFGGDKDAPGSLVDALMRTLETMIQDKGQTSSNGAPLENALLNSPLKGTSSDPSKTITDTPAQEKLPSSEVLLSYLKKLLDQSYHADILGRLATDLSGPDTGMRNSAAEVVRECLKVEEIRLEINEKVEMLEKLRAGQAILTDKNGDILDWTAGLYNLQNTQEDLRRRKQEADKLIQEWKAEDAKLAPLRRRNEELECKVDEMKKSQFNFRCYPCCGKAFLTESSGTVPAEKVEKMEITIGGQAKAISHLKDTLKAKEFSLEAAQKDLEIKRSQLKLMENLKVEHAQAKERGRVLADKVADLSRSIKDKDELLALARDEAQKAGVDLFEKGKEIKRLQHELAQAKNEISTLEPLREEVFIRKQERDKARYELEWAQREMEKLKVEIKDQHLNAKAEKETRAALNKRLASAWQERTTLIEGLKSRDKDVQELQIEVANARIQVAEAQAKVAENAAPAQPGADAPRDGVYKLPKVVDWRTLKAENDRIEAENKALEAGIAAMAVQLSEEEREVRAKEKRLKELREENRAWEKRHKEELAKEREKERQEAEKSK
jgi:chromosome segregation ATPase